MYSKEERIFDTIEATFLCDSISPFRRAIYRVYYSVQENLYQYNCAFVNTIAAKAAYNALMAMIRNGENRETAFADTQRCWHTGV